MHRLYFGKITSDIVSYMLDLLTGFFRVGSWISVDNAIAQ